MKRYENNILVDMTPEEIAERIAEQEAYVPPEPPPVLNASEKLAAFLQANPDVLELIS